MFLPVKVRGKRVLFETDADFDELSEQSAVASGTLELTLVCIDPERELGREAVTANAKLPESGIHHVQAIWV